MSCFYKKNFDFLREKILKTKKDSTAIGRTTAVTKSVTLFVTKKYKKTQKIVTKGITEDKNTIKKKSKN